MKFKELLATFIAGTPIKRKVWKGYWLYKRGRIQMHTKEGLVVDFQESKDIIFSISGILEDDWEVATAENTEIVGYDGLEPVNTRELFDKGIIGKEFSKAIGMGRD